MFVTALAAPVQYTPSADVRYSQHVQPLLPIAKLPATPVPKTTPTGVSNQVQTILTELSEATPPNSIVAVLGVRSFLNEVTNNQLVFRTKPHAQRFISGLLTETNKRSSTLKRPRK